VSGNYRRFEDLVYKSGLTHTLKRTYWPQRKK